MSLGYGTGSGSACPAPGNDPYRTQSGIGKNPCEKRHPCLGGSLSQGSCTPLHNPHPRSHSTRSPGNFSGGQNVSNRPGLGRTRKGVPARDENYLYAKWSRSRGSHRIAIPTEINFLGAKVVEYARTKGFAVPFYRAMTGMMKAIEHGYLKTIEA